MPYARAADGTRLYYEVSGAGEPLLLIAGRASDHHLWNAVRGDFVKRFRTIVYDSRGTGQSDAPEAPPYSTRGFAGDAAAVLDAVGVGRAHVYGVSMGGAVAQWLAIDHPERVGALVLGCSTPGGAHAARRSDEVQALIDEGNSFKVLDTFFAHRRALPRFFSSMREAQKHPMPEYAERLHGIAAQQHDAWDRLPSIAAPTLVLHGADDPVTPVENARLLAERIPDALLEIVPGGRHMFFIEYRRRVDRDVIRFLERHPIGSSGATGAGGEGAAAR